MRLSQLFLLFLAVCISAQLGLIGAANQRLAASSEAERRIVRSIEILGLSDFCIATDARYVRHLAVSDRLSPFMDHPGSIEHFPTGSFWIPEK